MKRVFKFFAKWLFKVLYRVEVKGLEHYHAVDQSQYPLLMIANHVSILDGPMIDLFIPGNTSFMVDISHTKKWYERLILNMTHYFKVDLYSPYAAKHMIKELKQGKQCMIFPEGRITTTGSLMKVYDGTGLVAEKTGAMVLPIHISGAVYSKCSYLDGSKMAYIKQFWFPKITLTLRPAKKIVDTTGAKGSSKHKILTRQVMHLLRDGIYYGQVREGSIFASLIETQSFFRAKEVCVEDVNAQELSLKKLVLASKILGHQLKKILKDEVHVGLMLPNVAGMPVSFFALQAYGYVPAMINFTSGIASIKSACDTAELKTIITSKKFVEVFELTPLIESLKDEVRFIYLEDVKETIGITEKLTGVLRCSKRLPGYRIDFDEPAVILFTSGSEGVPKGVVLSHQNLNSNIAQIGAMVTLLPGDTILNALPTFHCFGLTAGMLWPILSGAKVYLYPSPIHYAIVPEMAYQKNVKLMFGTDTFYTGYARKAHPYDFYSVDKLIAGAERLRPETRRLYADKYHKAIFEGYGVTETTPVLSINTPLANKEGSVGQFVPDISYRLEPVDGITEGGRLFVKGPNVMKGYLMPDNPGALLPPKEGWHDTGDIVDVDEEGFVWIKGRAKRFAKIGGEMVSLTAVENYINEASPEGHHVVVAVSDERKGERLVLVTDDSVLCRSTITDAAKKKQLSEIMIPKTIILVEQVPILGTGKTNYPEVQKLAEQNFNSVNS